MDYLSHYLRLVEKAKNRKMDDGKYYEKHHIIPKSIYSSIVAHRILNHFGISGKYAKDNRINLLPEEHYVAHLLLVKIFEKEDSNCYERMVYAANMMSNRTQNNKKYAISKIKYSQVLSKNRMGKPSGMSGKKWSKERKKIGNVLKGKTYEEMYGVEKAKELKEIRAKVRDGKTLEEIYGEERGREIRSGMTGKVFSKEHRERISKSKTGISISEEKRLKIKIFMGNDKTNPSVDQTIYQFKNVKTGEIIEERKIDMKKKYGCLDIHKLIDGRRKISKGWIFIGNKV